MNQCPNLRGIDISRGYLMFSSMIDYTSYTFEFLNKEQWLAENVLKVQTDLRSLEKDHK